jgi:hypothetical protein
MSPKEAAQAQHGPTDWNSVDRLTRRGYAVEDLNLFLDALFSGKGPRLPSRKLRFKFSDRGEKKVKSIHSTPGK